MIRKRTSRTGSVTYECFVYDPSIRRKRYVGSRKNLRGDGGAQELERQKKDEFTGGTPEPESVLTIRSYAPEWMELHHGPKTRRPQPTTRTANFYNLKPFLEAYGDRPLDGGITRREALKWAKQHPHNAKTVSALFNDAIDDEVCSANPFANRRQEESRERKHIAPITEGELATLADIALRHWGSEGYGLVVRAFILFAAWVGCRPGETFRVEQKDLNFAQGEVSIRRVKRRGGRYPTDKVAFPNAAQEAVLAMPSLPAVGPIFRTISGCLMNKSGVRYYWHPVRTAFRETMSPERWHELCDGEPTMDFYVLRHFCASIIVDRGGNEDDVAAQLGNSPEVCRETYIHSYVDRANARNLERLNRTGPAEIVPIDADRRRRMGGAS